MCGKVATNTLNCCSRYLDSEGTGVVMKRSHRRTVLCLATLLLLSSHLDSANGQAIYEFNRLTEQFTQQWRARQFKTAGETAERMRRLAEGRMRNHPKALPLAVSCEAHALEDRENTKQLCR